MTHYTRFPALRVFDETKTEFLTTNPTYPQSRSGNEVD